jgi:hypothetical protein
MSYTVESLPGAVATALLSFRPTAIGSPSVFLKNDLAIAVDKNDHYYFGLTPQGTPATELTRSTFSAAVRNGTAVPAKPEDHVPLKLIRAIPGQVANAIVVALLEHQKSEHGAVSIVGWRASEMLVVVMLVPERADTDQDVIGGATSMGVEVHYHIETTNFSVARRTLAR